jgi:hypothetical protein
MYSSIAASESMKDVSQSYNAKQNILKEATQLDLHGKVASKY